MVERTLSLIKPNAVKAGKIGEIVGRFEGEELKIVALKMLRLSKGDAERFYEEHKEKPFFQELVGFLSSGPICAIVLQGEDVVRRNRDIMGHTDPTKAEPGTLRAMYANSITENAVHGSDSGASASREIDFFFTGEEIL